MSRMRIQGVDEPPAYKTNTKTKPRPRQDQSHLGTAHRTRTRKRREAYARRVLSGGREEQRSRGDERRFKAANGKKQTETGHAPRSLHSAPIPIPIATGTPAPAPPKFKLGHRQSWRRGGRRSCRITRESPHSKNETKEARIKLQVQSTRAAGSGRAEGQWKRKCGQGFRRVEWIKEWCRAMEESVGSGWTAEESDGGSGSEGFIQEEEGAARTKREEEAEVEERRRAEMRERELVKASAVRVRGIREDLEGGVEKRAVA
ncbi:hypothetical protein B0H13DRAFT_1912834 [Mycena leptocephala]|nr:hypothetical protein B0H13DRAFT_1912834 [Mycena leptocephala]